MSEIREDKSKYKAVFARKVSENIFLMHFCQFQPENCDAKCSNWKLV